MTKVLGIVFLCFLGILYLGEKHEEVKKPLYFSPPGVLKHFHFGFSDFMADMLWLRYLQNADFCSYEKGLPAYKGGKKHCNKGWAYRMVDLITDLAPRFKTPYAFSTVMYVFTGDKEGAKVLLKKGLRVFPEDQSLHFYATFFYSSEGKHRRAAFHAHQAAFHGGPKWLYRYSAQKNFDKNQISLKNRLFKDLVKRGILTEQQKQQLKTRIKE